MRSFEFEQPEYTDAQDARNWHEKFENQIYILRIWLFFAINVKPSKKRRIATKSDNCELAKRN